MRHAFTSEQAPRAALEEGYLTLDIMHVGPKMGHCLQEQEVQAGFFASVPT